MLRYAGLFTWGVIVMPLIFLAYDRGPSSDFVFNPGADFYFWGLWCAWLGYGVCYGWLARSIGQTNVGGREYFLIVLLNSCAGAVSFYSGSGLGNILLMVSASLLPWVMPVALGLVFLSFCEAALIPIYVYGVGLSLGEAIMQTLLYLGVTGFVFFTSLAGRQQSQGREEQRRLNAELRATRALLAESVRVNERTRISRELHDLLGHHLTALSLNLEIASHLASGQAQEHVGQAQTLAKLLLSDVREAVSQLRDDDAIDMRATLLPLAENVPSLRIDMQMPQQFLVDDPERAHVLLRCTQEIITNAVRHSGASLLRLRYVQDAGAIRLDARDDGRGADVARAGNGLTGMRERLAAYGGTLQVETAPGSGFVLRLELPLADDARLRDAAPRTATSPPP
ncbi:two-component sensor histidine kinase [Xanthomonas citri pv. mangiferaeindicae]|nr:two-component sensor histidine kinase [Xanthomonas citri pv. mangiferaeindicae]